MSCAFIFKMAKKTMGAVRTCLLVITIHMIHAVTAQEKRGPAGFIGMRGKKYSDLTPGDYMEMYKRQPQQYLGGKGKNWFEIENEDFKRSPMGFVGMRGKKGSPFDLFYPNDVNKGGSLIGEIDYAPSDSFEGKNDYPLLNDLLSQYLMRLQQPEGSTEITMPESTEEDMTNEINKRAANMHQFYGVRGKKSEQKRPYDLSFRGKFIGVRGKKDLKNSGAQEIKFLLGQNGPWPKRKAQMGFFGMRGKKWTEASLENESPN